MHSKVCKHVYIPTCEYKVGTIITIISLNKNNFSENIRISSIVMRCQFQHILGGEVA